MRKRFLSGGMALLLCFLLPAGAAASASDFSDVSSGDWYYDAVTWAVQNDITTGTSASSFSPGDTCNAAQIITFLWRAAGKPASSISNPFRDVSSGDYYYRPALWASEKGLVSGDRFHGEADCTRAMAVTFIWKAKDMPFSMSPASFSDVPVENLQLSIPVSWAVENGVTTGTGGGAFSPDKTCTRAEIVTFLLRAFGGGSSGAEIAPQDSRCAELLRLINAERSGAGLKPLETMDQLDQAAGLRADDISKGFFENRPDGSSWESVLDTAGVAAAQVHESILGGKGDAAGTFATAMNTEEAFAAIMSEAYTHVGIGYTHRANGYGGYSDFWSLLYITGKTGPSGGGPSSPSTGDPGSSSSFTPVPMEKLANRKSLQKKATDEQLAQAYDVALEIVTPLAGLSRTEQLQGIASAVRERFDSGMEYSMSSSNYNDPYGYFILGSASCAGCTRATGLCLNILGIPYEHVNEGEYSHQWCRVNVDGVYWICDAYGLYCGPEPAPYAHPYL